MSKNPLILSIDLGGTKILTSLVDRNGQSLSSDKVSTPAKEGKEAVLEAIVASSMRTLDNAHLKVQNILAVAMCAAGPTNPYEGILYTAPNIPDWENVRVADVLTSIFDKPAYVINDAKAAALGELYFGAARKAKNYIFLSVSTGIGGGIVINRAIYQGAIGTAGELGHMVIDDKGPICNCGNRGCWEMLASGTAMAKEAKRRITSGGETTILNYAEGSVDQVDAKAINQAAIAGDRMANELLEREAYYLGVGLSNLINIFNPELIVIGGGLSNIGDRLLKPACAEAERRAFKQPFKVNRFAIAELGTESGAVGAAVFAFRQLKILGS